MINKRYYIIKDNSILLRSNDRTFPKDDLLRNQEDNIKIEMGCFKGVKCFTIIPGKNFKQPTDFEYFNIKKLIRNNDNKEYKLTGLAGFIENWISTTKFCGRCGSKNKLMSDEIGQRCPECGLEKYPKLSPAIIVAIIRNKEILLAHNAKNNSDIYSLIAGYLKPGETFEQCVEREVWEEVKLQVKNIKYFGNQPWLFPDSHMIGFLAEYDSGIITVDGLEIDDAAWFQASNLPLIPQPGSISREMIDDFIERNS